MMRVTYSCLCLTVLLCGHICFHAHKGTGQTTKDVQKQQLVSDQSKITQIGKDFEMTKEHTGEDWTRDIVVHLLGIVEQINIKLESLQSKMDSLDKDVTEVKGQILLAMESSSDEVKEMKSQIIAVEQRLTSRITAELSHVVDKVELLQYRGAGEDKKKEIGGELSMSEVKKELAKFTGHITDNVTNTFDKLRRRVDCNVKEFESGLYNSSTDLSRDTQLLYKIDKLIGKISAENWDKESANLVTMETSQEEMLSNQTGSSSVIVRSVKAVLREALIPTKCVKGMIAAPYTIIHPTSTDLITISEMNDVHDKGQG